MRESGTPKPTFLDRFGPEGLQHAAALGWGVAVFIMALAALATHVRLTFLVVLGCAAAAASVVAGVVFIPAAVGWGWKRFFVDGTSTPYVEQYSFEDSLVMQGRVDEAVESLESIASSRPEAIDVRIRAADLHCRETKKFERAASLFREAQATREISAGQFVYVTNRLVDLYVGPLNLPGKAMVELRRLIDRMPGTPAADHARTALRRLKEVR